MAWRRYPFESMWRDMEEMRSELEGIISQTYPTGSKLLLPGGVADRMLPAIRGVFRVDVREHADEVIIVADLPGIEKENVSLELLNPRTFEIACERKEENEGSSEGYFMRERISGSLRRVIAMPTDVTDEDSTASFKNGVLEVHLKKVRIASKPRIQIE
jgi:HSP20 family protein